MAEPKIREEGSMGSEVTGEKGGARRPSLVAALMVTVIGVVGEILVNAVPGRAWMNENDELIITLSVIVQTLIYVGAVWLGVVLAYRGIVRGRH
jgi:hypothetical protein